MIIEIYKREVEGGDLELVDTADSYPKAFSIVRTEMQNTLVELVIKKDLTK